MLVAAIFILLRCAVLTIVLGFSVLHYKRYIYHLSSVTLFRQIMDALLICNPCYNLSYKINKHQLLLASTLKLQCPHIVKMLLTIWPHSNLDVPQCIFLIFIYLLFSPRIFSLLFLAQVPSKHAAWHTFESSYDEKIKILLVSSYKLLNIYQASIIAFTSPTVGKFNPSHNFIIHSEQKIFRIKEKHLPAQNRNSNRR